MEDEKIVDLLSEHDEEGLEETKRKYEKLLINLSVNITKNTEDALECINDVYMKIWDTIPPYRPTHYKSFICKLTRQISIDKFRYNHRSSRDSNNSVYLSDLDFEVSSSKNVDEELEERLLVGTLNKFIDNLDIENKALFVRKYFFFEDSKSLAKRYGFSVTNVNVKISRLRKKLCKYLESEGYKIENNR